jgi:hypothetical protein
MSYTEISRQNEANREKAKAMEKLQSDMANQESLDLGIAEGKNQLLAEIQARADAEARANNVSISDSAYAKEARQGIAPSYYDSFKDFIATAADDTGTFIKDTTQGLSDYFMEEPRPTPKESNMLELGNEQSQELEDYNRKIAFEEALLNDEVK